MEIDIKIMNGTIIDGAGKDAITCDVGIKNGRITNMGELSTAKAEKMVDSAGLIICPGFIDAHSHSDTYLLPEPSAASKVLGITTEIFENCGASAAPLNGNYRMPSTHRFSRHWKIRSTRVSGLMAIARCLLRAQMAASAYEYGSHPPPLLRPACRPLRRLNIRAQFMKYHYGSP